MTRKISVRFLHVFDFFMLMILSRVRFFYAYGFHTISVRFCHAYDFRTIFTCVPFFHAFDFVMRTIFVRFFSCVRFPYDFVKRTISVRFFHAYDLVRYAYGSNTIAYRDNHAFISSSKKLLYNMSIF